MEKIAKMRTPLQELYDLLDEAYWAATSIEAKDRFRGISEVISDILTDFNRADISARTKEYLALKKEIVNVNKKLKKLKKEIDDLIKKVKLAGKVAKAIDKVINIAAKASI